MDIDDRIPCDQYKRPVFGHCTDPNELWVPLIEKSYAKLFGCYGALTGGHTRDALVDLTGGISSDINLKEVKDKDQLWQKLIKYVNDKEGLVIIHSQNCSLITIVRRLSPCWCKLIKAQG